MLTRTSRHRTNERGPPEIVSVLADVLAAGQLAASEAMVVRTVEAVALMH